MTLNLKILGSLDDFLSPSGGVNMVGRNMANYFFFRALMKHGSFDEYHFFLSNKAHRKMFEEQHGTFLNDVGVAHKIRLFDRVHLPDAFSQIHYTAFHQSDHMTHLAALARLRNEMNANVPITAFIHSLSYPAYMTRYLELNASHLNPADAILCSSECGKQVVENCLENALVNGVERAPVSLKVLPLGIDDTPHREERNTVRARLGFQKNQVVGLCFGRFSDFDKMDLFPLLQAFQEIHGEQYRLVLAGAVHDKEYFQILQLWVKALGLTSRVEFVVQPDDAKKRELFFGADFFVSIADNPQETFGLTVLESMHAGTPVVVSDFDGYRELAGDEAGIRVPTTWMELPRLTEVESLMDMRTLHRYLAQSICVDMPALIAALRTMYTDEVTRRRLGKNAQIRFETHFAHAKTIGRLEQLWQEQKAAFVPTSSDSPSLRMNIYKSFSHYVTRHMCESDRVKTTLFAGQLLKANVDYPLLPSMSEVIDAAAVREIAQYCRTETTIERIYTEFGNDWKLTFIVMWMLKHNLLESVTETNR